MLIRSKNSVGLICLIAVLLSGLKDASPQSALPNTPINELTHVVFSNDDQSISFFGRYNSEGPRSSISYAQVMAAALLLPPERGQPMVRGSVPGFSLNLTADTLRNVPVYVSKMGNGPEVERLREKYYSDQNNRAHLLQFGLPQAWPDVREMLKRDLYSRLSRREGDAVVAQINSADSLTAALNRLQQGGVLRPDDCLDIISKGIDRFKDRPGNIFFFPEGTTEALYGADMYSEPAYYGIPKDGEFSRIVFQADLAIKNLARNIELKQRLPFHLTYMEWVLKNATAEEIRASLGTISAIQAFPGEFSIAKSSDARVFSIEQSDMTIQVRPYDSTQQPSSLDKDYTSFLTTHFGEYAREYPDLWNLRELFKILSVARILKSSKRSIYIPMLHEWRSPKRIKATWLAGTLGAGGEAHYLATFFNGGVGLQIERHMQQTVLAPDTVERFSRAAATLVAFRDTAATGVCYDGRRGCNPEASLSAIKIELSVGSNSLSTTTVAKMKSNPATRALLEDETKARAVLSQASENVRAREQVLSQASGVERGQLQVELVQARQRETDARSALRVKEIKVQEAAKVIEEVELISSSSQQK